MLEMQIVLRGTLSALTLHPGIHSPEVARRRNITVTPSGGAEAILADRQSAAVAA
jgi:hypothetical protein